MSQCMSWNKCKNSCCSMGASSYRWFHDGCCECVGATCVNYGINDSRCLECPPDKESMTVEEQDALDKDTDKTEAYALPDQKAETIVAALMEKLFPAFGIPEQIVTDRGTNFLSKLMTQMCEKMGIKYTHGCPYKPSTNGQVERFNATLSAAISYYVNRNHSDWCRFIPYALNSYRTSVHSATRETPAYLMMGRDIISPFALVDTRNRPTYFSTEDYLEHLVDVINHAHTAVRRNIEKETDRQTEYRQRSAVSPDLKIGQHVYMYTPHIGQGNTKKFAHLSTGPYRVIHRISRTLYEISLVANPPMRKRVHVDRLFAVPVRRDFATSPWDEAEEEQQRGRGEEHPSAFPETRAQYETAEEDAVDPLLLTCAEEGIANSNECDRQVHPTLPDPIDPVRYDHVPGTTERSDHGYNLRERDSWGFAITDRAAVHSADFATDAAAEFQEI